MKKRLLLCLLLFCFAHIQVFAGRIYVDINASGTNDGSSWDNAFVSLHLALDASLAGDSVFVAKGKYVTDLSDRKISFSLKDSVSLFGSFAGNEVVETFDFTQRDFEMNKTVLSGDINGDDLGFDNMDDNAEQVVTATLLDSCVFDGFTVSGGKNVSQNYGAGIYVTQSKIIIRNCAVLKNAGRYFGGGISFIDCDTATVINSVVVNNSCITFGGGGLYSKNSPVTVINTIVWENYKTTEISNLANTSGTIYFHNSLVQLSGGSSNWVVSLAIDKGGNIDKSPYLLNVDSLNVQLAQQSPLLGMGDAAYGKNIGQYQGTGEVPVYKQLFVSMVASGAGDGSSWADAFTSIEQAIDSARFYTKIYVATGNYIPENTSSRDTAFLIINKKGVELYGGFAGTETDFSDAGLAMRDFMANETVLSADFNNDDIGFENNAENAYHVLNLQNTDSTLIFDGFTISGGNANGLGMQENGGGAFLQGTSSNRSFGVTFKNSVFTNNYAIEGAAFYADYATVNLYNCLVVKNKADDDGAAFMYWWGAYVPSSIVNTTVASNWSNTLHRAALYSFNNKARFVNTLIWENANSFGSEISAADKFSYSNCDINGSLKDGVWKNQIGIDMGGNIQTDPLFVDTAQADFRIYENSPLIGAGNNMYGANIGWDQSAGVPVPKVSLSADTLLFNPRIVQAETDTMQLHISASDLIDSVYLHVSNAFNILLKDSVWHSKQMLAFGSVNGMLDTLIYVEFAPFTETDTAGKLVLSTKQAENDTVGLIGKVLLPKVVLSPVHVDFGTLLLSDTSEMFKVNLFAENVTDSLHISVSNGFLCALESEFDTAVTFLPIEGKVDTVITIKAVALNRMLSLGELIVSSAVTENDTVRFTVNVVVPELSLNKMMIEFPDQKINTESADSTILVVAKNLISDVLLVAPQPFSLSLQMGADFIGHDSLLITGNDFVNDSVTVYARFNPSEGKLYEGRIECVADSIDTLFVGLKANAIVPKPVLSVSTDTLVFDKTYLTVPSQEMQYRLTGTDIVSDIVLTAGDGFQFSFVSNSYLDKADTLLIPFSGSEVDTVVYARYLPVSTDQVEADIKHRTKNADSVSVHCIGGLIIPGLTASTDSIHFGSSMLHDTLIISMSLDGSDLKSGIVLKATGAYQLSETAGEPASFTDSIYIDTVGNINGKSVYLRIIPHLVTDSAGQLTIYSELIEPFMVKLHTSLLLPTLSFSPQMMGFGSAEIMTAKEMYFILNGSYLTEALSISLQNTPSFSLSLQSGEQFAGSSQLQLDPIEGRIENEIVYVRFQPDVIKDYADTIRFSAFSQELTLSGTGVKPAPHIATSKQVLDFGNIMINDTSGALSFELNASHLTEDVLISMPNGYAVSQTENGVYASSLTIINEKDSIRSSVFVKCMPTVATDYSNFLTIISSGIEAHVNVFAAGYDLGSPSLSVSPADIEFGNVVVGAYSDEYTFNISGNNLTTDVLIEPTAGIELKLNNGDFLAEALQLTPSEGVLTETIITVRVMPQMEGEVGAFISVKSEGAANKQIYCSVNGLIEPILVFSQNELMFEPIITGKTSAVQEISVAGMNLNETIMISASQAFQLSTSPITGFSSLLYLIPATGEIDQPIYVRFVPNSAGMYDGSLTVTSSEMEPYSIPLHAEAVKRPTHYFVKSDATGSGNGFTWNDAFNTIQDAFASTISGDSVFVAQGVYTPHVSDRNVSFVIPVGVKLFGGFMGTELVTSELIQIRNWQANATVLSGDLLGDDASGKQSDNSYHVLLFDSEKQSIAGTTAIDGFYISGGYADGTGVGSYTSYASGIFIKCGFRKTVSPSILNCVVENNYGKIFGGGMAIFPSTSETECNPLVSNVIFRNNTAGQDGGGVYIAGSVGNAAPMFTNVEFYGNSAQNGGAIYNRGACGGICKPVYKNVQVCGNSASYYGGGVYNIATDEGGSCDNVGGSCMPEFINTNIVNNRSSYLVGGAYNVKTVGECSVSYVNTIVWGNNKDAVSTSLATVSIDHSIIENSGGSTAWITDIGTDGGNNFDQDPMFVDADGCDVRLLNGSVALMNGNSQYGSNIGYYQFAGIEQPPVVILNESIPAFGEVAIGTVSSVYNFTVSARNVTSDLIIASPEGYELSLADGDAFMPSDTVRLNPVNATVAETSIFIRLKPIAEKQYNGLLEISSEGALSKTASLTGSGLYFNPYIYVKADATGMNDGSSWADAYTGLQSAMQAYEQNRIIVVAAGVYKPHTINRNIYFNVMDGMKLFGGFAGDEDLSVEGVFDSRDLHVHKTVLSGDLLNNDQALVNNTENSYHVVKIHADQGNISNATIIDGFTIEGGNASSIDYEAEGGGVLVLAEYQRTASPVLRNLVIKNNSSLVMGGGISVNHKSQSGKLEPVLQNIVFEGNRSQKGGGLALGSGFSMNKTVAHNLLFNGNFASLEGGAIHISSLCDGITEPYFESVAICSNMANQGSAIFIESSEVYNGCSQNNGYCKPTFVNMTVTNNAYLNSVPVYTNLETGSCTPQFINSIVWGADVANAVVNANGASASFKNCLVKGSGGSGAWLAELGADLGGNIDSDPVFVEEQACDLSLKVFSPALNAGDVVYGTNIGVYQEHGVSLPPYFTVNSQSIDFGEVFTTDQAVTNSFFVSGTDLMRSLIIKPATHYEISLNSGSSFVAVDSIELVPVNGTVSGTEVFVRFTPSEVGSYLEELSVFNQDNDTLAIQLLTYVLDETMPLISVDKQSLQVSASYVGGESYVMGFEVYASKLTDNLTVTAPDQISISNDGEHFTNELVLIQTDGSASGIVYFKYVPTETGQYSGLINLKSEGAVSRNVVVYGEAVEPPLFTFSLMDYQFKAVEAGAFADTMSVDMGITGLIDNVAIIPPANFEISVGGTSNFTSEAITLFETDGAVHATLYVRYAPQNAGTDTGAIQFLSRAYSSASVMLSGSATGAPGIIMGLDTAVCAGLSELTVSLLLTDEVPATVSLDSRIEGASTGTMPEITFSGDQENRLLTLGPILSAGELSIWIIAKDEDGRTDSVNYVVTVLDKPQYTVISDSPSNCDGGDASLYFDYMNPFTIVLDGEDRGAMQYFTFTESGSHTFELIDVVSNCSSDTIIEVVLPEAFSAEIVSVNNAGNDGLGSVEFNIHGAGGSYYIDYEYGRVINSNIVTGLPEGHYSFSISDDKGCFTYLDADIFNTGIAGVLQCGIEHYPSPFTNSFMVKCLFDGLKKMILMDEKGVNVYEVTTLKSLTNIEAGNIPSGKYYLHIVSENKTAVLPIMKK